MLGKDSSWGLHSGDPPFSLSLSRRNSGLGMSDEVSHLQMGMSDGMSAMDLSGNLNSSWANFHLFDPLEDVSSPSIDDLSENNDAGDDLHCYESTLGASRDNGMVASTPPSTSSFSAIPSPFLVQGQRHPTLAQSRGKPNLSVTLSPLISHTQGAAMMSSRSGAGQGCATSPSSARSSAPDDGAAMECAPLVSLNVQGVPSIALSAMSCPEGRVPVVFYSPSLAPSLALQVHEGGGGGGGGGAPAFGRRGKGGDDKSHTIKDERSPTPRVGRERSAAPSPSPRASRRRDKRRGHSPTYADDEDSGQEMLKKCQESVDRLDSMFLALEAISSGKWSASASQDEVESKLRSNSYYDEIQVRILQRKINWLNSNANVLARSIERQPPSDMGLSGKARECSRQATVELMHLREMENESKNTLKRMLVNLSSDVPVFADEARGALHRAGPQLYDGAKKALSNAMAKKEKSASKKSEHAATVKRGHLNQQSVDILEAWLVEHFDHPYPSLAVKKELVQQTGFSLVQVSNWLSNARIRIWRPAVESMHRK